MILAFQHSPPTVSLCPLSSFEFIVPGLKSGQNPALVILTEFYWSQYFVYIFYSSDSLSATGR